MIFSIPASSSKVVQTRGQIHLQTVVKQAFETLGWDQTGTLSANVGVNLWSWGETITVQTLDNGRLTITSRCRFPLQIMDWGKNGRNVDKFCETLAAHGVQTEDI